MKSLLKTIVDYLPNPIRPNYRDRRGHYASQNLQCLRDQYWKWTKEPETNATDLKGAMKMLLGEAIEKGLVDHLLSKLSLFGYHLVGTQVPVGGSNPDWNGYVDAMVLEKDEESKWRSRAIEIKTKSGFGADLFLREPIPQPEHLIQLGLYLKDLHEKKITSHGSFLYVLLSDNTMGTIVTFDAIYDQSSTSIQVTRMESSQGAERQLNLSYDLNKALARWTKLDQYLLEKKLPPGDYQYRYPINQDSLGNMSDTQLKKLIEGTALPGDWQVKYSSYKDKQLALDGISPEISDAERQLARVEYKRRHPKSKI